jgi:DNA repair exonuclease SbcCD ATPase subunit|tara:strand:- start:8186 stop:9856 length:1671 start_codon:yes stop_codon:yes gene_type:complete
MRIDYIEFKNFASYGNQKQRIEFKQDASELFLTLGKNGDGKTTIANAIIYALYGKVEGVKLSDLPNRINKELHVKIGLMCGTMAIEIERGLMPNKFSVLINGVEFDKAGKKSVQDYLEDEVFGIPYHVFKNIIILSVNDFKSFLTMSNSDKKQIIDKMFGFSILNDMQKQIKDQRRDIKFDIDSFDAELNQIMDSIGSVKGKLNTLLEESADKSKSKIQELKDELVALHEVVLEIETGRKAKEDSMNVFSEQWNEKRTEAGDIKREIDYLNKKLKLYESGHCPTCETKLTSDWHTSQKTEFADKIDASTDQIKSIKAEMDQLQIKVIEAREAKVELEGTISDNKVTMRGLKGELIKLKNTPEGSDFDHLRNLITEFEEKEAVKSSSKDTLNADYHFMEIVEQILGEDGVKNLAVKTILPGLNTNIAAMAQTMHLQFHIRFDEKFNCIINHLGEDINPMTLSTGERKKADFIVIIAIIKILKLRFPQLNLLFLDELLSSVDHDGVYNILKILNQVIKEHEINTFVINHSVLPHEIFDKKIQIYRENGFSKFTIENID